MRRFLRPALFFVALLFIWHFAGSGENLVGCVAA
jgi:hypothetical protein